MPREPRAWSDGDIASILVEMLRLMDRVRYPDATGERPIALRGFSWIVNPFDEGGVVVAIEISLGAAIAGPFTIDQAALEGMIVQVLAHARAGGSSSTVH